MYLKFIHPQYFFPFQIILYTYYIYIKNDFKNIDRIIIEVPLRYTYVTRIFNYIFSNYIYIVYGN